MKSFKKIISFALLSLLATSIYAQQGKADARIDSSRILIGDHVHLALTFSAPAKAKIIWPVFNDTLSHFIEIIDKGNIDTSYSADHSTINLSQVITVTCFDSGSFLIPPVSFIHFMQGDTNKYISSTSSLLLYVNTIAVDTTADIKGIKAPLTSPLTLWEVLPWVIGGVILAAIITLTIIFIIRKRKKKPLFGAAKSKIPAHIRALQALEELRLSHMWQQGKIKQYHSHLTDIVKGYIEERFNIPAMEMITPDLLENIKTIPELNDTNSMQIRVILQLADMVKFAKFNPLPDEHDNSLRLAVQFVTDTSPLPVINDDSNKNEESGSFIDNEINQQNKEEKK
jgi:hypothetical protein